jgi:hypothetical protein
VTAVNPWQLHPFVHGNRYIYEYQDKIENHILSSLNCWLRSLSGLQLTLWCKGRWHLNWWECPQASPQRSPTMWMKSSQFFTWHGQLSRSGQNEPTICYAWLYLKARFMLLWIYQGPFLVYFWVLVWHWITWSQLSATSSGSEHFLMTLLCPPWTAWCLQLEYCMLDPEE